jgi:tetratricopeptide (TPR) repeat protein
VERIRQIEESSAIFNKRAANRELWGFLERVHTHLSENDPLYPYYLTWLAEAASNGARSQVGPDPIKSLNSRLKKTNPQSDEFDPGFTENRIEGVELSQYRFSIVYVLCKVFVELGDIKKAIDTLDEHRVEFCDHPLYCVLRGEVVVQKGTQEAVDDGFESIWKARNEHENWPEVQKGTANVIVEALEQNFEYEGYNSDIPQGSNSLLQKAKGSIAKALDDVQDHSEYLFIKSRVQTLDSRFDAARQTIRQAIKNLNPNRPTYDRIRTRYRIELSNIDIQEQEEILQNETKEAVDQLEQLREDYKQASQQFQTRTLQFLGFFTGLIGIVVITAQVTISVDSTAAAIRLILVLMGGLLFSFGGFGFLLPNDKNDNINIRILGVLASGGTLIAAGILL